MSLATTGGGGLGGAGGAGGGLTLAHDASGGGMMHHAPPPPPPTTGAEATGQEGSISLPSIEVCDKTQKLSLTKVKAASHLPLTAVDLHAGSPTVAFYPPCPTDTNNDNNTKTAPSFLGKMKAGVALKANNETAHKTLRKYLTQAKPYSALKESVLTSVKDAVTTTTTSSTTSEPAVVVLDRPHLMLGMRRLQQLPKAQAQQFTLDPEDSSASTTTTTTTSTTNTTTNLIAEESVEGVGCWWTNSTLLGHSPTKADYDVDRVAAKIRLDARKKALTLLPEEGVQLLLNQARQHVLGQYATSIMNKNNNNKNKKKTPKTPNNNNNTNTNANNATVERLQAQMTQFPMALALPAWCFHDGYMEALYEAAEGVAGEEVAQQQQDGATPPLCCLFQRSVAALTGCLAVPHNNSNNNNTTTTKTTSQSQPSLLQRLAQVQQALLKRHQQRGSPGDEFDNSLTVIAVGTTPEGMEVTAIQLAQPQSGVPQLPFEQVTVLANVSRQWTVETAGEAEPSSSNNNNNNNNNKKSAALLPECLNELNQVMELVAPEVNGPAAIMTYGTTPEQEQIKHFMQQYVKENINNNKNGSSDHDNNNDWLNKVPVIASPVESIATGTALLGGIAMGRHNQGNGKSLPLKVQTVATVATGVVFNYSGKSVNMYRNNPKGNHKSGVKTIFDFDRRLPAGPYSMEFKASECVVHAQRGDQASTSFASEEDAQDFLKLVKQAESSKCIPDRETAALAFQVQIYQQWTRHGPWQPVGNPIAPLVKLDTPIDQDTGEDQEEEVKIACEQVSLELSVAVTGILATAWVGERESVVQAVKSARGRLYEYYGWLAFAILFFGGFFVKSYWEDYVWKRDTQRLLDYYSHVIPGSVQDGDRDTASWLAYKYRNNKAKLWDNLETKYGVPVPEGEWPEDWEDPNAIRKEDDPEQVDLDDGSDDNNDGKSDKAETKDDDETETSQAKEGDAAEEEDATEDDAEATTGDDGDNDNDEPDL